MRQDLVTVSLTGTEQSKEDGRQGRWPASKMADRHQSYFLLCPLDEWNYGASDVEVRGATAVETINNTDSSGQNTSLMLM